MRLQFGARGCAVPGQTDPLAAAIASMSHDVLADATLEETLEAVAEAHRERAAQQVAARCDRRLSS